MNLPAIAVEFLDAFPGLVTSQRNIPIVKVHFYIFASNILDNAKGWFFISLNKCSNVKKKLTKGYKKMIVQL